MLVRNLLDRTDDTGVLITHLTRALIRQSMEPLNIRVGGTMVVITAAPLVGDTMEAITAATPVGDTMEEIPVAGIMEETLVEEALVGDITKV